jgi:hypothetical protein
MAKNINQKSKIIEFSDEKDFYKFLIHYIIKKTEK